jgi:hypothetical protein
VTTRKKGYPILLTLTILLTAGGIASALVPATALPFAAGGSHVRIATVLAFLVAAGVVCTLRKRFFTEAN